MATCDISRAVSAATRRACRGIVKRTVAFRELAKCGAVANELERSTAKLGRQHHVQDCAKCVMGDAANLGDDVCGFLA